MYFSRRVFLQIQRPATLGISVLLLLASCVWGSHQPADLSYKPNPGDPVETRRGNSAGYQPVFEGQTRGPSVITATPIEISLIAADAELYKPWSLKFISRSEFLVAQKNGFIRVVSTDGTIGTPISGVPPVFFNDDIPGSNAGLFDIALDPDFLSNRTVYFSYAKGDINRSRLTVARATLDSANNRLEDVRDIYQVTPAIAGAAVYGGRLVFDPSGFLMVSVGDRHRNDSQYMAQNLDASVGKILRIDKEGNPAPGNPFVGKAGALPEIWAYGIRSPLGLAFHPMTGELWEIEHGPKGGDEVNIIKPGVNYGWPVISYGVKSDGSIASSGIHKEPGSNPASYYFDRENTTGGGISQFEGMEQPRYYWDPSIAPGGMTFYRSDVIREWKNNIFVAALSGKHLIRLIVRDGKVIGEERFLADQGVRLRDVQEGPDGALYVICDMAEGRIYRISKK
ncbi:PQQ-dependent sugar dehydrogenase [Parapedobacter tibetensis]|uniref:PQQ-dependent sugar dehydrogenase n=1 Tax=Parapedobacter tibetensis TaxID=2972951 RepID=UPI00214DF0EA|nr:PQQ-dependent sugar dehydrogenase [Parapedobacter tibetensis]